MNCWLRNVTRPGRLRRALVFLVLAGIMLMAAAACGGATKGAGATSSLNPTTPSPASSPTATPSASVGDTLESRVLPAPDGYALSTSSDVTNGPVSPAEFDRRAGKQGLASALHFVAGYDVTYDSDSTPASVEIVLFRFASPADALRFREVAVAASAQGESPVQKPFRPIQGAVAINGTKASDGVYEHAVVVAKRSIVMVVDYTNDAAGPLPAFVGTWAEQQYARL